MHKIFILMLSISLLLLSACSEDVNSDEVETEAIWAGIFVEVKNDISTKVTVEFNRRTFDGDNLILVAGDQVTATVSGVTNILQEENEFLDVDYETRFNFDTSDELVRIALSRPSAGTSAPNSSVFVPTAFSLLQPLSNNSYSSNDTVVTNWSNIRNGAEVDIIYSFSCSSVNGGSLISSTTVTHPDDGFFEFSLNTHPVFDNAELDTRSECLLSVSVNRTNQGSLDPTYRSGLIRATQSRSVEDLPVTIVN